ncbi:pyrazinamidase/nicotinamidase [Pholiota molesta]|nr:pyrazinamidase/nicotinamidase [Pholiota molesta]
MSTSVPPQNESLEPKDRPTFVPALIVIDMQHDFVHGSLAVPGAESIIGEINALLDLPWKIRVGTRDFHPKAHISFAETHGKPPLSTTLIYHPDDVKKEKGVEQVLWPVHCVADTKGADFVEGLNSTKLDVVIHKGTHAHIESYSAFKDIWGHKSTELPGILEERGVTDIFFVGVAGDYCVKYTAIDAVKSGYRTWLVTDGIKFISDEEIALQQLSNKGVRLTTSKDVKQRIGQEPPT